MRIWFCLWVWFSTLADGSGGLPLPAPLWVVPEISGPPFYPHPVSLPKQWITWNLQWFPGHTPTANPVAKADHERDVKKWLGRWKPDVAILEEVLDADALKRSVPELPWQAVTRFSRAADEGEKLPPQNLAICSRVPWVEAWEMDFGNLPMSPDRPVRGFLGVMWRTSSGETWTAYAVHLKSNRGGREGMARRRERAIDYLRLDWRRRGLSPEKDAVLLAGDFNSSLKNPEFRGERTIHNLLEEGWVSVTAGLPWPAGATVRPDPTQKYPATDFDHILLSPGWVGQMGTLRWKAGVMQSPDLPGDHWPVWMKLEKQPVRSPYLDR
ncbi:endonuclease/exonuclease/phosphatase family protein [bacterium]|nr:endonuclease/exonuclease/phosphatase family protein [bacterium]NBV96568.1 endonuclease/exonuclease/phosphatase family protein [Verrucomicrobiota bacterium]